MLSFTQKFTSQPFLMTWIGSSIVTKRFAARKGTRERKNKKKVKVVVEKVGFIPHNLRNKDKLAALRPSRKFDDAFMKTPIDEVYAAKYYKWKIYPFAEAVNCHRETHHPEMYNHPNAPVKAIIELNMEGEKKTKFVNTFNRICDIPYHFDHGEIRSIIAFAKDVDVQDDALKAGAGLAGGIELIKNVQSGKVALQDFQYVIAHPDIMHELAALRGLLKKNYPNQKSGTLDVRLDKIVHRYLYGINYSAIQDEFEKDFGSIDTTIGTLNMDIQHLEENFASLVRDVMSMKPKRDGFFIRRALLMSPPSGEQFKVDHDVYLNDTEVNGEEKNDELKEEIDERVVLS